ncbi:uncharacterized protein pdgfbb isoform X2 [Parambassis ranga]|nr:uncharacterized protein LOC114439371 isoform X2 [Parambassis ranga]
MSAANGGQRLPRSLDAVPAQQAVCKVRTEVVEVTRAMLDRSNANFLLWPPCVEVQRCSGCCNTKSLQCVPVFTHTRYLQVMKIEYINKRPTYAKAVVSVVDDVECRCQPTPRVPASKKKSSRRQHSYLHQNLTLSQAPVQGQVKLHSKDELHQWDELKQNQRAHLEDLLEQRWSPRGDTFTRPGGDYTSLFGPHWAHNSTRLPGTEDQSENQANVERRNDNKTASTVDNTELKDRSDELLLNNSKGRVNKGNEDTQTHSLLLQEDKGLNSYTSSFFQTPSPQAEFSPVEEPVTVTPGSRFRPTKEPNPEPREQTRRRDNETPDEERILQIQEAKLQEERKELLLLHKRLDQEKEILRQQQIKQEEEERQRETDGQHHLHIKHQPHLETTTQTTETTRTSTTTTQQPAAPPGPRLSARPNQRRRVRKNRKRISKAAMRAMLM